MSYEPKENSGSLFRNKEPKSSNSPVYTGSAMLVCPSCGHAWAAWVSGWVNTIKATAEKWLNVKFKPKDAEPKQAEPVSDDGDESDLPF